MNNHRIRPLLLATGVYLIVLLLSQTVMNSSRPLPGWIHPAVAMIGSQLILILAPALLFAWLLRLPFRETFKLNTLRLSQALKFFLVGLLSWPTFTFLGTFSTLFIALFRPEKLTNGTSAVTQGISPWLVFLTLVLVAPICEEFFFRGLLVSVFEKYSSLRAIWVVGIPFGLLHLSYDQVLGAIFVGCLAGWLVTRTRSLLAGIFVHTGSNFISSLFILLLAFATNGNDLATEATGQSDLLGQLLLSILVWGAIALITLLPIGLILRGMKRESSGGSLETAPA